ncbi:class I SAM-dependent methyltransferase [Streptomyces chartreusis]|uniref:class I SAM-dependent methyltransferase n=1 Tax=Streptomyces chartreusis TaxID=1969 RepID=UPI0036595621
MTTPPAAWAAADPYTTALRAGRGPLFLRRADGWLLPLDVERWCTHADPVDLDVLDRCEGAVLDVGCGPGRLVAALSSRGRSVLGIDVSETAVHHAVRLGARHCNGPSSTPRPARVTGALSCSWRAASASAGILVRCWTGCPGFFPRAA